MDGTALDDRTLRRIMATLVALAALAERAGSRSFPVRWLVLAILRHAEIVARDFVVEATQWPLPGLDEEPETGSSPVDAALLGLRFRMLAAVLGALLCQAGGLDVEDGHVAVAPRSLVTYAFVITPRFARPRPNDTS